MGKYYSIDPETCSLEELERTIEELDLKEQQFNTLQLSAKTFLNSIYGALGAAWYNLMNIDMAESVTLQSQHLIKFSVKQINDYFRDCWHLDTVAHHKVAELMKKDFPDFDEGKFCRLASENKLSFDTLQIYGDSFVGESVIQTTDGDFTVEELFNESSHGLYCDTDDKIRVSSSRVVRNYSISGVPYYSKVNYIMRHRVNKDLYKITAVNGAFVICTCDHSLICTLNKSGNNVTVSPLDLLENGIENYSLICNDELIDILSVEKYSESTYNYVYDISVDDVEHSVYANGILVHNTDSVRRDSIIRTRQHPEGISIEDFYNENIDNVGDSTKAGHESVFTDDFVLNSNINGVSYAPVKRIIRHKVNKPMWKLKSSSGREVLCTDDHSLIIFRDGVQMTIRPSQLLGCDELLEISNKDKYLFAVESCEQVGEFVDEYVYDIEMDDDTHTFFCNDILVHNSAYITFQPLIDVLDIPLEQQIHFDLNLYEGVMEDYMDDRFNEYAKAFHCKENLEKFELEKVSRSIIMLAKKNYMCDVAWVDSGAFLPPLSHVTYTGFDVVKGATPEFCRKEMKMFTEFVLDKLNNGIKPTQGEIVKKLREIKSRFVIQSPNDISKTTSISEYEKFVMNDKDSNGVRFFEKKSDDKKLSVPIHVRAAAVYNNMLFNKAKKYLSKYNVLRSGDKVRFYYTKPKFEGDEDNVFGFVPDALPLEFAPQMDIDTQFEKMILNPLNRIISALGYNEIPPTLTYTSRLF